MLKIERFMLPFLMDLPTALPKNITRNFKKQEKKFWNFSFRSLDFFILLL